MPGTVAANAPGTAVAAAASLPFWGPAALTAGRVGAQIVGAGAAGTVGYKMLKEHPDELVKEIAKDYGLAWILRAVGHK